MMLPPSIIYVTTLALSSSWSRQVRWIPSALTSNSRVPIHTLSHLYGLSFYQLTYVFGLSDLNCHIYPICFVSSSFVISLVWRCSTTLYIIWCLIDDAHLIHLHAFVQHNHPNNLELIHACLVRYHSSKLESICNTRFLLLIRDGP